MTETTHLQGFQRRFLRGRANPLRALVQVSEDGISESVIAAVDQALRDHELVKVRLLRPADKKALASDLAERTAAELCGVVGHTVILYRQHPERARIILPTRPD